MEIVVTSIKRNPGDERIGTREPVSGDCSLPESGRRADQCDAAADAGLKLIDWEMAGIGDPLQDVSWWYWIDYVNSVGFGLERLGGLPSLAEIYEQWHLLTGLPIDHAKFYDLFSVVRYAIVLEKKFLALEKAGLDRIDNFAVPFVEQQLRVCQSA